MTEDRQVKGGTVPVRLASLNFEYEGHFIVPSFDLTTRRPELLRALHNEFRSLYSIDTEDVQVSDGSQLSDVRISVDLFGGNAAVEVSAEKLRMVFKHLPDRNFLSSLCQDCITSATRAIVDTLPESALGMVSIDVTLHLDSGNVASRYLLNRVARTDSFDFSGFGDVSQYHDVKFEIEHEDEQWTTLCHAYADISDEFSLILSCYTLYGKDGEFLDLEVQIGHVDNMIRTLLSQMGISLQ